MRRFLALAVLLLFSAPFGASIAGCGSKTITEFCNGGDSGPVVGQVKSITLSPIYATYGVSLDYGQIGPGLGASAVDCKGNSAGVRSFIYATTDMTFADINPYSGQVCAGTWNRNTGGGVPDYTTCTAPVNPPANTVAYVTATAEGAVSNAIPVYVHPVVTSVVVGTPTPTASCATTNDPSTNCCAAYTAGATSYPAYTSDRCLSQGVSAQLTARVYRNGTTNPADNITCKVGHVTFGAQNSSVLTVDQNGVVTAQQPGSTIVTASIAQSATGGAAGFFATCPPASITLAIPNSTATGVNVSLNNSQPLTVTVKDTNGVTLSGTPLTYISTTPTTIPVNSGTVTPTFPGTATITAVCEPPTCNFAPFSQIGLYGNGKSITSNGIQVTASGTNASVLYMASTQSQYLLPYDFSTNQPGSLLKLPYFPNSMVISQDGSTIYMGSSTALMTVAATSNSLSSVSANIPGTVLAVSPDGGTVVVTDPARQTVSLVANGSVSTTYGGVGTRAQWSPDSQTVYITGTNNQLLVHSAFTGWYSTTTSTQYTDVAITVPNAGAFFSTTTNVTEGRSYCPTTTVNPATNPPTTNNVYYPVANDTTAQNDRVVATTDGAHLLGATAATTPATLNDTAVSVTGAPATCTTATGPIVFTTANTTHPLTGIAATSITGIFPASNTAVAFVTYTGASGLLPLYVPGTGAVSTIALSNGAIAPVAGVFSTDNKTFFAGTTGDNQVHLVTVTGSTAADTSVIAPKLPDNSGNIVVPNLLVQRPKKSTS